VGENMPDICFAAVEMNGCDQSVITATDVKNNPVIHFIGGWKNLSQPTLSPNY
jgi:hypothetical protein